MTAQEFEISLAPNCGSQNSNMFLATLLPAFINKTPHVDFYLQERYPVLIATASTDLNAQFSHRFKAIQPQNDRGLRAIFFGMEKEKLREFLAIPPATKVQNLQLAGFVIQSWRW